MKKNTAVRKPVIYTHEGAKATYAPSKMVELRRAIMACFLWEDQFYESGEDIASRIKKLVPLVKPADVADLAIKAREMMKLRHVPLLLVREMARGPESHRLLVADTLSRVIQRADELAEFLAIYWLEGKQPLSAQVKKGLARAFAKFKEYDFAKYNRDGSVKLRDAMFLSHPKPTDEKLFRAIAQNSLKTPDTWEVELSGGADKKATFMRLITQKKLGALALLRNLRNMEQAGVPKEFTKKALEAIDITRVLPHRFIAAARAVPSYEDIIEPSLLKCAEAMPKFKGKTILVVDVSGSMDAALSGKSDMSRLDAACGLAIIAREICEDVRIFSFSDRMVPIPSRRGFGLADAISKSQAHSGTLLGRAIDYCNTQDYDRLIVITDEQSADEVKAPKKAGYMINVASYKNGVGYGKWNKIDGFSEAIIRYIAEYESGNY